MSIDAIIDIQPGRCVIRGRVTSLDDKPSTVAVGKEGRITPLFHFGLTDATGTIQGTAWDRNAEHKLLRVGMVVVIRNVVVKACRQGFTDYSDYSFNFSKQSVLEVVAEDDPTLPRREKVRPLSSLSDEAGTPAKRTRLDLSQMQVEPGCCETPSEPFCSTTGKPHPMVCLQCGWTKTKKQFCPKTGLEHE